MTRPPVELAEAVVVVTGAASGIGKATAERFASHGAAVAVVDLNQAAAEKVAAGLPNARAYGCDVADSAAVDAMIDAVTADFGRVDVLVNNAGIAGSLEEVTRRSKVMERFTSELLETLEPPAPPAEITLQITDEGWRRMFAIHVDGTFFATRRVLRDMIPRGSGVIVNMSSICGLMGCVGTPSYSAAKAAVNGFTKAVAKEVAGAGVRVNAIAPGYIATDLSPTRSTSERALTVAQVPAGRLGTTEEVADAIIFLASPASSYFNGAVLSPNGGAFTG